MSPEDKDKEIEKMKKAAKTNKSKKLEIEANYMKLFFMPAVNEYEKEIKVKKLNEFIEDANRRNDKYMKLRAMYLLFGTYWKGMEYAKAFNISYLLDKELQKITDKEFPQRGYFYSKIGEAYYFFEDYKKAIPYLRKALKEPGYFYDSSNLFALNTIGSYYLLTNKPDSAEYYFRSAYLSKDNVYNRSVFDAVSLCNLGKSLVEKKKYEEALSYFRTGLAHILEHHQPDLAPTITIGLGKCYLGINDMKKVKDMIDTTRIYIEETAQQDMYRSLYPLMSKYYGRINNNKLAEAYIDSTISANNAYEKKYNSLNILRAEQELFEAEAKAEQERTAFEEKNYKSKFYYSLAGILLVTLVLLISLYLYRKKENAYHSLVIKNQDWAKINPTYELQEKENDNNCPPSTNGENSEPDEEDISLMQQVHQLMATEKIYNQLDLTLDSLAKSMNVNRNYLSKAINKTTNKNFNTYINEYRVKEAIKIMSEEKSDLISVDAIGLEVGFSNRTSFYQSFKKITGLSPAEFRRNARSN